MIDAAIEQAMKAHGKQTRKGTDLPYIIHPLAVGIILAKVNCADEVITAGILHDTVEDTALTLDEVRDNFGETVAAVIAGASEPDKTLPWEDRKKHTIKHLRTASLEVRLVACADKLHNVRSIAMDYRKVGESVWGRFKRGRTAQEWYYRALVDSLCRRDDNVGYESLFDQFKLEVDAFFNSLPKMVTSDIQDGQKV